MNRINAEQALQHLLDDHQIEENTNVVPNNIAEDEVALSYNTNIDLPNVVHDIEIPANYSFGFDDISFEEDWIHFEESSSRKILILTITLKFAPESELVYTSKDGTAWNTG